MNKWENGQESADSCGTVRSKLAPSPCLTFILMSVTPWKEGGVGLSAHQVQTYRSTVNGLLVVFENVQRDDVESSKCKG